MYTSRVISKIPLVSTAFRRYVHASNIIKSSPSLIISQPTPSPSLSAPAIPKNRTNFGSVINSSSNSAIKKNNQSTNQIVLWKIYGSFHRHNTLLSLVAVVEDTKFMEKNEDLSYNEKVIYYLQLPHHPKLHVSAGQLGFRKGQRAEYEAAYQVTTRFFKLIEERNLISPNDKVELILKDYGRGREAFLTALQGKEGSNVKPNIVRISDSTKLKFGGDRPKKLRRL